MLENLKENRISPSFDAFIMSMQELFYSSLYLTLRNYEKKLLTKFLIFKELLKVVFSQKEPKTIWFNIRGF